MRQLFFAEPGQTLGGGHKDVLSQANVNDPLHPTDAEYVENVMWEQAGVLFVTLNIPGGSNNDADPWYKLAETPAQVQERQQRTDADLRWLDRAFAQATTDNVGGVVIMELADMWDLDGTAVSDLHLTNYESLIQKIADKAHDFAPKKVLLFNGDSHLYRSDNPLVNDAPCVYETGPTTTGPCVNGTTLADAFDTHNSVSPAHSFGPYAPGGVPNFHRVVVHGSTLPFEYLRLTVNTEHQPASSPTSFGPFSWERVQPS